MFCYTYCLCFSCFSNYFHTAYKTFMKTSLKEEDRNDKHPSLSFSTLAVKWCFILKELSSLGYPVRAQCIHIGHFFNFWIPLSNYKKLIFYYFCRRSSGDTSKERCPAVNPISLAWIIVNKKIFLVDWRTKLCVTRY